MLEAAAAAATADDGAAAAAASSAAVEYSAVLVVQAAVCVAVVLRVLVAVTKVAAAVVVVVVVKEEEAEGAPTGVATAIEAAAIALPTPSFSHLNPSHHSSASPCSVARTCLRAVAMSSLSYEPKARMYASKLTVASFSAAVGWSKLMGGVTPRYGGVVLASEDGVGGAMMLACGRVCELLVSGRGGGWVQHCAHGASLRQVASECLARALVNLEFCLTGKGKEREGRVRRAAAVV